MKKAYLYIRFSSKRQELGDSVSRQIKRAEEFCSFRNLELSDVTFEDLGVSAFKEGGKRPALVDLIECVRSGKIEQGSYILFEDTDRLSRQGFKVALDLTHDLVNSGVYMVTMGNGQIYDASNIGNLSSTLPLLLDADRARMESERKSVLVRSAKAKIRDNKVIKGKQPFWITIVDGEPTLNEKAEIAEKMIEYRLQGCSAQKVAKLLNQAGYKSPTGKQIGAALVKITIANTALYGAKTYNVTKGTTLTPVQIEDGLYPPLCTRSVWKSMQYNKAEGNFGKRSKTSPFSMLFKCWKCGSALTSRTTYRKGQMYVYRRCIGNLEGRCDQGNLYRSVDTIMMEQLKHLQYQKVNPKSQVIDPTLELQDKLDTLNQAKELLSGNPVALANIYNDIVKVQEQLQVAIDNKEYVEPDIDFEYISKLDDVSQQNTLLRRVIERITFKKLSKWDCRATVLFKNGHKISLVIHYTWQSHEVRFVSDTKKLQTQLNDLTKEIRNDWELID